MKRFQIYIDEESDEALAIESAEQKISKAALIRRILSQGLRRPKREPLDDLVGDLDIEQAPIDEVVFGP